jgi:hypothetical protein
MAAAGARRPLPLSAVAGAKGKPPAGHQAAPTRPVVRESGSVAEFAKLLDRPDR